MDWLDRLPFLTYSPAPALIPGQFPVLLFAVALTASPSSFRRPGAVQPTIHPAHTSRAVRLDSSSGPADLVLSQVRHTHTLRNPISSSTSSWWRAEARNWHTRMIHIPPRVEVRPQTHRGFAWFSGYRTCRVALSWWKRVRVFVGELKMSSTVVLSGCELHHRDVCLFDLGWKTRGRLSSQPSTRRCQMGSWKSKVQYAHLHPLSVCEIKATGSFSTWCCEARGTFDCEMC